MAEPGTDPPGFATDEPMEKLEQELKLPGQHLRDQLERILLPIIRPMEPTR